MGTLASRVLGQGPVHLFVLWSEARVEEQRILDDVAAHFTLLDLVDITWTPGRRFADNLSRMYGSDLPPGSEKEVHCGSGPFLLVVVADPSPRYRLRRTSRGLTVLNSSVFDARRRYRAWTGGGYKIHASDSVRETRRNLALLLGEPLEQVWSRRVSPDRRPRALIADLAGSDGWDSRDQLELALTTHGGRIVRRTGSTAGLVVVGDDVWELALVLGDEGREPGRRSVQVAGVPLEVTLRSSRLARPRAVLARLGPQASDAALAVRRRLRSWTSDSEGPTERGRVH